MRMLRWCLPALVACAAFAAESKLADAVMNQDREAVRSLLQQKADVNAAQTDGATALLWAAHWDDVETADLLVRAGANVKLANRYGLTPLFEACSNGSATMRRCSSPSGGSLQ